VLAIVLALGTSVAYGTSNFLGPLLGRRHHVAAVLLLGQLAALAGAVVLVVLSGQDAPPTREVLIGLGAGIGNILGLACFYRSAQLGPVSIAAAMGALGTTFPVLYGLANGESLAAHQVAGVLLAVAGAILAAQKPAEGPGATPAFIGWSLLGACGFGGFLVALPEAAAEGTAWALLDARLAVVVLLIGGIAVLRTPATFHAPSAPLLAAPGVLLLLGTLAYAEATARGQISVVAVLSSLATVVTVALAFLVLGERLAPLQRTGVACAVAGTILLAL
jgi:drug/metabolite transporter (DMT)-like permease